MRIFLMLFICLLAITWGRAQQSLTLADAIRIGQENSRMLKISSSKAIAARARQQELRSALLPSLKLDGGYRRLSDVDPFQIKVPIYPQPITIAPTVLDNYSLHVGVQQPIFTGFRLLSNAKAAEHLARASAEDQLSEGEDLILNTITAYWVLYQASQTKQYTDENVARLESYLKDTKNLMNAGLATRNDLLRIEVQANTAKLSQIDASNDLQIAMMNLNNVMGQPLDTEIRQLSQPDSTTVLPGDLSVLESRALAERPDLKAMAARVEASRSALAASRAAYWPQLVFSGNYYFQRPNQRYQPTRDEFLSTWDVGVQLQLDIWNWGATRAQAEQAGAALTQSQLLLEQTEQNATLEVSRSYLAIRRAGEKVSLARLAIDQAEENARSTQEKFRSGLATSTELLDAALALLQAKTNYTGALVEMETAGARLKRATGEGR